LRDSGVVVLNALGELQAQKSITTAPGTPDHKSVDIIVNEFFEFVAPYMIHDANMRSRSFVYSEEINFTNEGKAAGRAKARGVIEWNLRQDKHPIYGVYTKALHSFMGGRFGVKYPGGRDGMTADQRRKRIKQMTKDVLHHNCNFYTTNDNISDAYSLALFGLAHAVEKQSLSCTPMYPVLS